MKVFASEMIEILHQKKLRGSNRFVVLFLAFFLGFGVWSQVGFAATGSAPKKPASVIVNVDPLVEAEIRRQAPSEDVVTLLMVISRTENSGRPTNSVVSKTNDYGPMQVNVKNLEFCASGLHLTENDFKNRVLSTDPSIALPTAIACAILFVKFKMRGCRNFTAQLCAYNLGDGFCLGASRARPPMLPDPTGICPYSIGGCSISPVDCNTGAVKIDPNTGEPLLQSGNVFNPDTGKGEIVDCILPDLQKAMMEAETVLANNKVAFARQMTEQSPRTPFKDLGCLDPGFFNYFNILLALKNLGNLIVQVVVDLLNGIINAVCDYVNNAIKAIINSVLSILCLPFIGQPYLHLGSFEARKCNGVGLSVYGGQNGPGVSSSFLFNQGMYLRRNFGGAMRF